MITANATRAFVEGVKTLREVTTTERLSRLSLPSPTHDVWDSWGFWIGVKVLSSMLWWVIYFMDLKRKWRQAKSTQGQPEVRKEAESGEGDASRTPSISFGLTKQDIQRSVSIFREKFRTLGIDVIDHGVLQYTGEIIGSGRYSRVYAVKSKWPGHRVKVPLCVKYINNNRSTSVFHTCIEVMNVASLSGVPGVPRVVAVCLKAPPLIVMTRHSRFTLDVLLNKYALSDLFLLEVCCQLCITLDLIHRRKKIHNDVKGNNICVDVRATNHPKVTLIDYGLMTREGERLFQTPITEMEMMKARTEHARRYPWYDLDLYLGGPASPQTDIYSLAVLLRRVMKVMHEPPSALLACVKDGHGKRDTRPPLSHFKAVLQTSIAALSKK